MSAARRSAGLAPALILSALLAGTGAVLAAGNAWTAALRIAVELPATAGLAATALGAGAWIGARAGARLGAGGRTGQTGWLLAGAGPAFPGFLLAAAFAALIAWGDGGADGDTGGGVLAWMAAWTALALPAAAQAAHLARTALVETVGAPLAFGALARGLPAEAVLHGQARPAALGAVAHALGSAGPAMVTGTVAAEALFGLPGIGHLFVAAARGGEAGPALLALAGLVLLALVLDALGAALPGRIIGGTGTGGP